MDKDNVTNQTQDTQTPPLPEAHGDAAKQQVAEQQTAPPPAVESKTFTEKEVTELIDRLVSEKEQAVADAAKKAKMSADEAAAYDIEQKEKQLEEKEKALFLKELQADTKILLTEKNLPAEMLDFLISSNKENTLKHIDTFKAAYDKAVQEGITKAIAGKTPPAGSEGVASAEGSGSFLKAIHENQVKRN